MEPFHQRLESLIQDRSDYIKSGGPDDVYQFINTCVIDSFLVVLHSTYISYPNIADLYNRNEFFRKVISLLELKKYNEARFNCVHELGHGKVDLFGYVSDYFPLIDKLVWPENRPNENAVSRKRKLHDDVIVLGDPSDPTLILVHAPSRPEELPLYVNDEEKKRTYTLIFLMIGKDSHMTLCFPSSEETWLLYDNDPQKPPVSPFDLKELKNYNIRLVGYVNVTQAQEYKLGIPDTGEGVGTKRFNQNQEILPCVSQWKI